MQFLSFIAILIFKPLFAAYDRHNRLPRKLTRTACRNLLPCCCVVLLTVRQHAGINELMQSSALHHGKIFRHSAHVSFRGSLLKQKHNIFPAFPERSEFDIYASMTPAKEVGGDFYDFFLIDDDHKSRRTV